MRISVCMMRADTTWACLKSIVNEQVAIHAEDASTFRALVDLGRNNC